ncbi:MAG: acetyl-CoA carboxylase biotin carboxyl carrier protein [Bacteroidota bacterium]|nr:acetyl-CoA carboxylase biotin carboxyl carrier protein [Bacteroidota bacterium]|tara:strand:- start:362 stop:841 length:480 start_codon:yes stop_codon:yes gene_type:complete
MNIKEIKNLIKFVSLSNISEVKLKLREFKITIKTDNKKSSTRVNSSILSKDELLNITDENSIDQNQEESVVLDEKKSNEKYTTIKSPIIGTFYRKPSPEKDVFVDVGSQIKKGDTLCVIEAMKLFNEIESDVDGKIVKILVDDSSPVEFDQPLFLVDTK